VGIDVVPLSNDNFRVPVKTKLKQYIAGFSWQHWIFLFVQFLVALWILVLWHHLPNPGKAVAILAAVAAAMSIHGEMRGWQKAIWMGLIGCLLIVELRSISNDRSAAYQQALVDRNNQDLAFKGVRDAQDKDFSATAQSLTDAINGIQSTLQAADKTLLQTRPRAAIQFLRTTFTDGMPPQVMSGVPYKFNYYYENTGTATASNIRSLVQLHYGHTESEGVQRALAKKFEEAWATGADVQKAESPLVPNYPSFGTTEATFSAQDMDVQLGTIYYLIRWEYSDRTGRWRTDECGYFQSRKEGVDYNIRHTCSVFQRFRYPAPH
jgi:hypothetical protein